MRLCPALAVVAAIALGSCARPPATQSSTETPRPAPYLDSAVHARLLQATPVPPTPGSPAEAADHALSARYAALEGGDRWRLAQTHAEIAPPLAMQHFDCPLGTRLSQDPPPALTRLMSRALADASAASNLAKTRGFRARPVADDPERRPCIRIDEGLRTSASHPSGHAVVGPLWGMIFAEAAPDAAEELRRRGEEIALSRAVCALHYPADVAAGQALARSLYLEIRRQPDYLADLAAARVEIAQARTLDRANPGCAAERRALAEPVPGP